MSKCSVIELYRVRCKHAGVAAVSVAVGVAEKREDDGGNWLGWPGRLATRLPVPPAAVGGWGVGRLRRYYKWLSGA